MLTKFLNKILEKKDLNESEAAEALSLIASGAPEEPQIGAFLAALRMKGESVSELVGGARFMRNCATRIDVGIRECVDVVGTGGDGGVSFNISTTSALVAAGAGVSIAKHGNRAASGKSGSADMLAALGCSLDMLPSRIEECIAEHGIGFLFAQKLHPLMGKVASLRKRLKIRTIFNMLGPLANPAGVKRMVVGVYDERLTELYAEALRELGVTHALVVHGNDGLDEITCCDTTRFAELKDGVLTVGELHPELLIGTVHSIEEIAGGTPEENARIALNVLNGVERGAPRSIVLLNAAAACRVAGLAEDWREGIALAAESIDSGRAKMKLETLIKESRA